MEKTLGDIGIYTDVHESGNVASDRHRLYYATCKVCGTTVEKRLVDIKESNKVCRHKVLDENSSSYKLNDMPKGWMNQSKLNMRIYDTWKAMILRTTEKYWKKYLISGLSHVIIHRSEIKVSPLRRRDHIAGVTAA